MRKFNIYFNEKQQWISQVDSDPISDEKYGWITVLQNATDYDQDMLEIMLAVFKEVVKDPKGLVTNEQVLAADKGMRFMQRILKESGYEIVKTRTKDTVPTSEHIYQFAKRNPVTGWI